MHLIKQQALNLCDFELSYLPPPSPEKKQQQQKKPIQLQTAVISKLSKGPFILSPESLKFQNANVLSIGNSHDTNGWSYMTQTKSASVQQATFGLP